MKYSQINEDAEVKTLYVCRYLTEKSANALKKWAKDNGFKSVLDPEEMHVTIALSKKSVDWGQLSPLEDNLKINSEKRSVDPLGSEGAVVLKINSKELEKRWEQFCDMGCSWDHDDYMPHITITYKGSDVDLDDLDPYDGEIELEGETWTKVVEDWGKNASES